MLWLVVHLVDRAAAFAEARRVLAGRTARRRHVRPVALRRVLAERAFPSLERIDRARFPTGTQLVAELELRASTRSRRGSIRQRVGSREEALERLRARHISTLQLIDEDEYERGLAEAERTLPATVRSDLNWLVAVGTAA